MIAWAILVTLAAVLAVVLRAYRASLRCRRQRHVEEWWGRGR